jgi:mannosyltransferase OCH1-like enzyme
MIHQIRKMNLQFPISTNLPKIIHQIAPLNEELWPESWKKCYKTWIWKEWEYKRWNDEEDMRNFILEKMPDFIPIYDSLDVKIKKIDVFRFFLMYFEGGIYADMDFECCFPFDQKIKDEDIYLVESSFTDLERLHNSLMISKPFHPFWLLCIEEVKNTKDLDVINATGPRFLDKMYEKYILTNSNYIFVLPFIFWNPPLWNPKLFFSTNTICRHYSTMMWKDPHEISSFKQKYQF